MTKPKKNLTPPTGMTYREIAQVLGISWQHVRSIEQKALRKLYFRLKGEI